jgi:hypothetical protein
MKRIIAACAVLLLAGCGVQRQDVHPSLPSAHINPVDGRPIVIAGVTDSRHPIDGLKLSSDEKWRNVGGVARGGSGIAVNLEDGTTADLARELVVQTVRSMGYKTVADDTAAADVPRVKIDITQFSVGMPFNFFRAMSYSQQMIADIATSITVGRFVRANFRGCWSRHKRLSSRETRKLGSRDKPGHGELLQATSDEDAVNKCVSANDQNH